jgi:hypothetical protein
MNVRRLVRMCVALLWGLAIALYLAAKIHFFRRYDPLHLGQFAREHSVYWLAMAVVGLLIWAMSKLFPEDGK